MSDPTTTPDPDATEPATELASGLASKLGEAGPKGQIVTFYSYKGGVGRSMALANIAVILARDFGLHVVMIDWDLEAPGLHRYFGIPDAKCGLGVIDFFTNYKQLLSRPPEEVEISPHDLDIRGYARVIEEYDRGGLISFVSAGDQSDVTAYVDRVSSFDWDDFYRNWNGAQLIEAVRAQLHELGDVVLIDSRTGITDTGGICTLHLPDVVVLVFAFNSQNLDGIARIAAEISGKNEVFEITKRHPEALFLPSRKDVNEIAQLREWEARAVELFEPYLRASPRTVERFGDDTLECIRVTSVPYVPYFAFGEELAARTDKGYEMTAALEILADMISPTPPLIVPRKATSSQPHSSAPPRESSNVALVGKALGRPRREASGPGRRISHQSALVDLGVLQALSPSPNQGAAVDDAAPTGALTDNAATVPSKQQAPEPELKSSASPRLGAPARSALGFLGFVVLVGVLFIWISPIEVFSKPPNLPKFPTDQASGSSSGDGETEGDDAPETHEAPFDGEHLDVAKVRANVRFEFLTVYPRDRPPPRAFDGYLNCEIAIGSRSELDGWAHDWQLDEVALELGSANSEGQKIAEGTSIQNVSYSQFELRGSPSELPALRELVGHSVQARLVGPGTNPGWLTEAWQVAEAQQLGRVLVREEFRSFYAVDDDAELLVDVTPVIATMRLEYDGKLFATLAGWVARDPNSKDFVVQFIPVQIDGRGESATEAALAPTAEPLAPFIELRDARIQWLEDIKGQGEYFVKGSKRYYHLSVAIPTPALEEIAGVTYELPDGKQLTAKGGGARDLWPVTTMTDGCEGTVRISIERVSGEILPLSFDWCQDAVKVKRPATNEIVEPSNAGVSRCNQTLVAKNPSLAAEVCAEEYAKATDPDERKRLLANLVAATRNYGAAQEHCQWLEQAAEQGIDNAKAMLNETGGRCDPDVQQAPRKRGGSILYNKR